MPKVRTGSRWIMEKQAWVKRMYTCGYILYSYTHSYQCLYMHVLYILYTQHMSIYYTGTTWKWEEPEISDWEGEIQAHPGASANFTSWIYMKKQECVKKCCNGLQNFSSYSFFFFNYMTVNCKDHPFLFVNLFYTFCVQIF